MEQKILYWLIRRAMRRAERIRQATALYEMIRQAWLAKYPEDEMILDWDSTVAFNRTLRVGEVRYRHF